MPTREGRRSGALSISQRPHDDLLLVADPDDDWAPCQGHPPYATAGFVGCGDHWPPPADEPTGDHSARLAEASATLGSQDAAAAAVVAASEDPAKQDTVP
jgi:hypothetical protein